MKITAKQIKAGMQISVARIVDNKPFWERCIVNPGGLGQSDIDRMKFRIENNLTLSIGLGTIKKDSPVLTVESVDYSGTWGYYCNGRKVTFNSMYLKTNAGIVEIGNRQKVELINN
jgi:hypothetical protein